MKKILLLGVCCLCLCGCESNENTKLLTGSWSYEFENWSSKNYEFLENGTVKFFECHDMVICLDNSNCDDGCVGGSAVWLGKYKIKNNIVEFSNFEIDKTDSYNYTNKLTGPSEKIIIDFDNMYFCDRNKGLDCKEKYEKDD